MRIRTLDTRSGRALSFTELGFGGAPLGNLYADIPEDVAMATLAAAWQVGTRYFDTAPLYGLGLSEARLGAFLAGKPRDAFLISTKVGRLLEECPPDRAMPDKFVNVPSRRYDYDYSYDGVMRSLEQSLARTGLDRFDILYCHDADVFTHGSAEAADARIRAFMASGYRALDELRSDGTVAAIGAGLNEWDICERLAREGDFDIFLLAGRYTLLEQEALASFLPLCSERGIGIALGGPYNSGILATGAVAGATYNYSQAPPAVMGRVARIERVCAAHGIPIAAAALRFPLGHPQVVSVIPGGRTPQEVEQNAATFAVDIPPALWRDLKTEGLVRGDAPVPA